MPPSLFRRQIALPQDHGSWVFILSPLIIGLFAGGHFTFASLALVIAAMAAFLMRQPVTMAVKAYSGRRPRSDLPATRFWIVFYGLLALAATTYLITQGFIDILFLAVPGLPVFGWHLWLVGHREERRQAGVEIVATGVLSLAAPAAYWVGHGMYDPYGWWLWVLTWMQSAASIVYAYLRLEQRTWKSEPVRREKYHHGWRSLVYTLFNLLGTLILGPVLKILPTWIFLPYLLQFFETLWGVEHPAAGWKPTRIGIRQLIVSILWTTLFILTWRR